MEQKFLKGKRALITGGARRIGAACIRALAGAGADVVIHYNSSAREAEETAENARQKGVSAITVKGNLLKEDETRELFNRAVEASGPLHILVNSASIFPESKIDSFGWNELENNIRVNTWAPLLLSRLFASQPMFNDNSTPEKPEDCGNIINFLDTRIADNDHRHAAYHLSKRMFFDITRMLSMELAPGIKVNAIAPGLILPPEGKTPEYLEKLSSTNPLNRYGSLRDITSSLLFLIDNGFITGQTLFVDGGRRMKGSMYGV